MPFQVQNAMHSVHTRNNRVQSPVRRGGKQYLPGTQQRLIQARPVIISDDDLLNNLAEYQDLENKGLIVVKTMEGETYDLQKLEVKHKPAEAPVPNFQPDSIANDKNFPGLVMSEFNDPPPPAEFEMPVAPPPLAIEKPVEFEEYEAPKEKPVDTTSRKKHR